VTFNEIEHSAGMVFSLLKLCRLGFPQLIVIALGHCESMVFELEYFPPALFEIKT
jgi:hypothetical protein